MKLEEPKVEYWKQKNLIEHIAKCARVCYKSEPKNADSNMKLYKALISSNHRSMLRHGSRYFIIEEKRAENYANFIAAVEAIAAFGDGENPYINMELVKATENNKLAWYVSTNENFMQDHEDLNSIFYDFEVSEADIAAKFPDLVRCTFAISTTRIINDEFTRRSPNNIAGESTRYCNYSKDKFNGELKIGYSESYGDKDHLKWLEENRDVFRMATEFLIPGVRDNWTAEEALWFSNLVSEWAYNHQTQKLGRTPDDSRNVLPIGLYSTFVFTYTVKKWKEIINARVFNSTGKAHIDARVVANQILHELINLGLMEDPVRWYSM